MGADDDVIMKASFGAALLDAILSIPDPERYKAVEHLGLQKFLPSYVTFPSREINQKQLEQEALQTLAVDYLTPPQFRKYLTHEQTAPRTPASPFKALNYLLVTEILRISEKGNVNPLVYKIASARVDQQTGMENLTKIYGRSANAVQDRDEWAYLKLIHSQVLEYHRRFVQELPMLEIALDDKQGKMPQDLSCYYVAIVGRVDRDGQPINAQHVFL